MTLLQTSHVVKLCRVQGEIYLVLVSIGGKKRANLLMPKFKSESGLESVSESATFIPPKNILNLKNSPFWPIGCPGRL